MGEPGVAVAGRQRTPPADVLNGIAYDKDTRRIDVTGKKWPRVYQITCVQTLQSAVASMTR